MNKRKWRILYSSIACLGVCALVFTASVFAATRQNVQIGSSVSFFCTHVNATVAMQIDNVSGSSLVESATVNSTTCLGASVQIATVNVNTSNGTASSSIPIAVTLQTTGTSAFINAEEYFIVSFTITPVAYEDSRYVPIYYSVSYSNTDSFFDASYKVDDDDSYTLSSTATNSSGTAITDEALTIMFKLSVNTTFCEPMSSTNVGSFTIKLANSVANLSSLS